MRRVVSLVHGVLDVVIVLMLGATCGVLMSITLFVTILTEETLRLIQAYTLRPYHYLHFKLGVLRRAT